MLWEESRLKRASGFALYNVTALFVAAVVIQARYLPPILQRGYSPVEGPSWEALVAADPRVGQHAEGTKSENGTDMSVPAIVLFIDNCSDCNLNRLEEFSRSQLKPRIAKVVYILEEFDARELRELEKRFPRLFIGKAPPRVQLSWNVSFRPRVYALQEQGFFAFIQRPEEPCLSALRAAQRVFQ